MLSCFDLYGTDPAQRLITVGLDLPVDVLSVDDLSVDYLSVDDLSADDLFVRREEWVMEVEGLEID